MLLLSFVLFLVFLSRSAGAVNCPPNTKPTAQGCLSCPPGTTLDANNQCVCPKGMTWGAAQNKCVPACPAGTTYNAAKGNCDCPIGMTWSAQMNKCVPLEYEYKVSCDYGLILSADKKTCNCPEGKTFDAVEKKCVEPVSVDWTQCNGNFERQTRKKQEICNIKSGNIPMTVTGGFGGKP